LTAQTTQAVVRRVTFVFDFDKTLAEDSFLALLRCYSINPEALEAEHVQPLVEAGWEKMLARAYALIQASRHGPTKITRDLLAEAGKNIQLFAEVGEVFPRLRGVVERVTPGVEAEFYILTSGFVEIPRATPIAKEFKGVFGGEFHFDDAGELS
jgi:phosphoserine phosphatase